MRDERNAEEVGDRQPANRRVRIAESFRSLAHRQVHANPAKQDVLGLPPGFRRLHAALPLPWEASHCHCAISVVASVASHLSSEEIINRMVLLAGSGSTQQKELGGGQCCPAMAVELAKGFSFQ